MFPNDMLALFFSGILFDNYLIKINFVSKGSKGTQPSSGNSSTKGNQSSSGNSTTKGSGSNPKPSNPNYPSTTGNPSGRDRGNSPKK